MAHSLINIPGAYSADANGWVSQTLELTGDCWLEITLPTKGRVVIKKGETEDGAFPKALITKWGGPEFRFRVHHGCDTVSSKVTGHESHRFIKIITTETPVSIRYANI